MPQVSKTSQKSKIGFGLLIWRVASRDSLDTLFTSLALDGGSDHKHVRKKLFKAISSDTAISLYFKIFCVGPDFILLVLKLESSTGICLILLKLSGFKFAKTVPVQKQPPEMFCKNVFLFLKKTPVLESLFNNVAGLQHY